jgi:hypothetical protein
VSGCDGIAMRVSSDKYVCLVADPLADSLGVAAVIEVMALVPTNVLPGY